MENILLIKPRAWTLLSGIILAIGLCVLYANMLPVDITAANHGADGGDFLAAILSGGVPHPSGYPTYLLVGKLFQLLPKGSPYFKQAFASAIFSALAAGLLTVQFGLVGQTGKSAGLVAGALVAGGAVGIAPLFWSQAVIVEVYGLQCFFVVCLFLWVLLICDKPFSKFDPDPIITLLSILIGLGMGNHLTLLLAFPLMPLILFWGWRNGFRPRRLVKYAALIMAVGMGVYGYLPFLARNYPPVNWGNAQRLPDLIALVSGQIYQGLVFGIQPEVYFARTSAWASLLLRQFSLPGLLLGVIGAVHLQNTKTKLRWVYLWVFVIYSIFSVGYQTNDSFTYLLPVIMVFAIWIGVAVRAHLDEAGNKLNFGNLLAVVFVFVLLVRAPSVRAEVDPRKDQTAKHFAESCMTTLPEDAIVITSADVDTFSLWYYQYGLEYREDIKIVTRGLVQFDWYRQNLSHTYPGIMLPHIDQGNLEKVIGLLNPGSSICTSHYDPQEDGGGCICE